MQGDGLWDWIEPNMELFKSVLVSDIRWTLVVPAESVVIVAAVQTEPTFATRKLLSTKNENSQAVQVTFVIVEGSSHTLTPEQLAHFYEAAVSNGTANFTSTEEASGIKISAHVGHMEPTIVIGRGAAGVAAATGISIFGCMCFLACAARVCRTKKGNALKDEETQRHEKDIEKLGEVVTLTDEEDQLRRARTAARVLQAKTVLAAQSKPLFGSSKPQTFDDYFGELGKPDEPTDVNVAEPQPQPEASAWSEDDARAAARVLRAKNLLKQQQVANGRS